MSETPSVLVVVPTYGHLDFARNALASLFASTPSADASVFGMVVDDASPDWNDDWLAAPGQRPQETVGGPVATVRFEQRAGLTRGWNVGAALAYSAPVPADVLVLTNSDVLFTSGWFPPLYRALTDGWDFVGPVTNAPGPTGKGVQDVKKWLASMWRGADMTPRPFGPGSEDREQAAAALARRYARRVEACDINGFCMAGLTATWRKYAHEPPAHTFPPRIDVMPSGRKNPWPTMCGQESFLASRVRAAGGRMGVCLGAYVYHHRGVSRAGLPQAKASK